MPWQASLCGAVAGGFSAAVTTPLDVAKTRIMLAKVVTPLGFHDSLINCVSQAGTSEASLGTLGMMK